jgi:hypothetical protein
MPAKRACAHVSDENPAKKRATDDARLIAHIAALPPGLRQYAGSFAYEGNTRLIELIVGLPPGVRQYAGSFAYKDRSQYPRWESGGLKLHVINQRPWTNKSSLFYGLTTILLAISGRDGSFVRGAAHVERNAFRYCRIQRELYMMDADIVDDD